MNPGVLSHKAALGVLLVLSNSLTPSSTIEVGISTAGSWDSVNGAEDWRDGELRLYLVEGPKSRTRLTGGLEGRGEDVEAGLERAGNISVLSTFGDDGSDSNGL